MPSVSADMAGVVALSDRESTSSDSSLDTVVEIPQDKNVDDSNPTDPVTETPIEKTDKTNKELEQDTATAEVLADLFADDANTEQLTMAEKLQLQQEQESPELFSSTDPSIQANGADEFSG